MIGHTEIFELLYATTTWITPVLFAITLHEAAHGYAAWRLGNDTAFWQGLLSCTKAVLEFKDK